MIEENKIFVLYVGVQGVRSEDIPEYTEKVARKIMPTSVEGETIVIPTQTSDTRIECINPKYITDVELIKEHTELIKELKENLQNQLKQIKQDNNG